MLSKSRYRELVSLTLPTYFEKKIKLISEVLIENEIIKFKDDIGDISQQGGGIDKIKLSQIMEIS